MKPKAHPLPNKISMSHKQCLPSILDKDAPAISALFDLLNMKLPIVLKDNDLHAVLDDMQAIHIYDLLVTDEHHNVIGTIHNSDAKGVKATQVKHDEDLKDNELKVSHLMRGIENQRAVNYSDLNVAKVSDIIQILQESSQLILPVIDDTNSDQLKICAYFSAAHISHVIGMTLDSMTFAHSIGELDQELKGKG